MDAKKSIEALQFFATGLTEGALVHKLQGQIFKSQGFSKLGQKYIDHFNEEMEWVEKFVERILDLIMAITIRYFTKFGHSAKMAEVLTGAKAETVATPITEPVDVLYLGSGVLLGRISGDMADFIRTLTPDRVKRVVCFGSCAIIKSPVPQMRSLLQAQGIAVDERSFTCKGSMGPLHAGHPNKQDLDDLRKFVQTTL